eukprot:scaffold39081_cov28-Attheya_sp.AAC.3
MIGGGEEAHATDMGVVDQLFALVPSALIHWFIGCFLFSHVVGGLAPVMVPVAATLISVMDMV